MHHSFQKVYTNLFCGNKIVKTANNHHVFFIHTPWDILRLTLLKYQSTDGRFKVVSA